MSAPHNTPGWFEQVETVLAEVKIITRIYASNLEAAQRRFDDGDWETRAEEVGDIRETLSSVVRKRKGAA